MLRPVATPRTPPNWPRLVLAVVVLMVQVVMALTPLAEARGGWGVKAHVEAPNGRHYGHAEANCAFCNVRTIHAAVAVASPELPRGDGPLPTIVALALLDPSAGARLSHLSRAPPRA